MGHASVWVTCVVPAAVAVRGRGPVQTCRKDQVPVVLHTVAACLHSIDMAGKAGSATLTAFPVDSLGCVRARLLASLLVWHCGASVFSAVCAPHFHNVLGVACEQGTTA